ncbi:PGC-1 and ERR-induced regulator in muscle protein 1 [Octodon degus]|uniref:PGC-1 and ERR-induced regulator in muscle protein 1 n=1 Tax=Octodon degus TaxID=10160 RepID=A0A6P6D527_OCTDE|nr:PGC-1 and ERR-induced regulator in muscle protein 1 [Octodon degus]XP_023555217.1 PGC-1 and ERR-induced regulator in muscle protein 1 [Octodon degus]XP_023555219.1 PGC-1 and ERR-induced regulator in muscle protein 1 [Octodon degus]XP_023555220.1 PGC-1 and ERR-induced regulator in muscle protein 1 [Octodon degus]
MDNFQYSVQLSDQDWAEFSATADECGLLQAGLASGDELFSSDIDQGDSSGSSPPGRPPLLTVQLAPGGNSWQACEENSVATWQRVSRSQCEPVLALGASKQAAGTSTPSEALPSLNSSPAPLDQRCSFPESVDSSDTMQRLLQGPSPSPPGEHPQSSECPGHSVISQKPPDNPGTPLRSPGRKKRRSMGTKGGGHLEASGPALVPPGSPKLLEARPEEGHGLDGSRGEGLGAGTAKTMVGAQQNKSQPDSAQAFSTPLPVTEPGADQFRMTPRAELHRASAHVQGAHSDASMAKPDEALSTPISKPQPDMSVSIPVYKPQPCVALSTPTSTSTLHVDLPTTGSVVKPKMDSPLPVSMDVTSKALPHSASKTESDGVTSTPVPGAEAAVPSWAPVLQTGAGMIQTQMAVPPTRPQEKPGGAPGLASGVPSPGPIPTPKKKKVRFSMAVPRSKQPGLREATGPPSLASDTGTAVGGREGSAAWDAVVVGPRHPQPRILKHLPPPAPSASAGSRSGSCFEVTLPEAYEFFFCDTIEEEEEEEGEQRGKEEGAEQEAIASQATGNVQWPDICEFFFRDCHTQRLGHQGNCSLASPPGADPVPAVPPGDPVPFSIPEAYEHFLGEDRFGGLLPPTALLQLQNSKPPRNMGTRTPPEPGPAVAEELSLAVRQAGELRHPLTSFTFSQNDMCLVFVALATWAVRTSDLQTPDAWKTVLLANIGTISAIRYFRRQARRGRSPSSSPSRSPSSSS